MSTDRSLDYLSRSSPDQTTGITRSFPTMCRSEFPSFSGSGFLAGIDPGLVTVNAAPSARNLKLFTRYGGVLVRATRSAADGSYRFERLDENQIFQIVGQDDPIPPLYQAVARDFLVPVVAVIDLWRDGSTARAVCPHHYGKGTPIRILHADQTAWNADYTLSAVGSDWLEFTVLGELPAKPTGSILIQRRY